MQSTNNKTLFISAIALAIVGLIAAVITNASESSMIGLSYLLVPMLVFGIAGLSVAKGAIKGALVFAGIAAMALFLFLVVIFPML
jgi:hypothetical protein